MNYRLTRSECFDIGKVFVGLKSFYSLKSYRLIGAILLLAIVSLLTSSPVSATNYLNVSSSSIGTISFGKVKPSASGVSTSASDTLTVDTNCGAGYNVYVSAQEGKSTSLMNTNSNATINNTIATSSTPVGSTAALLSNNTWGLTADSSDAAAGKYVGLPTYANAFDVSLATRSNVAAQTTVTIYYGAKIDTSIAPGTYTGDILYTVLMNDVCVKYTLKFDGNSATTNNLADQTVNFGEAVDLATYSATSMIAKTGYHLTGWKIKDGYDTLLPTNNNAVLDDGESSELTLVAQWAANTYTIQYNKGSDTGVSGTVPAAQANQAYDSNVTLSANTLSKTGYHFTGYSRTNSSTSSGTKHYDAGTSYAVSTLASDFSITNTNEATMNLYPVFAANTFSITYSANGGTGAASKTSETASYGTNITMPTKNTLAKTGYNFLGWSLSSTATSATWSAGQSGISPAAIKGNVTTTNGGSATVYAVWRKPYMQTTACSSLTMSDTTTLTDSRDEQDYTIYRWPDTGTAGTAYPSGMAGYCIMTKDLGLGYVTGGSVTAGANLVLTTDDSAAEGTVTGRTASNYSSTNNSSNLQYINGTGSYAGYTFYSWGAAKIVCPKGWTLPTRSQYNNIISFMGGSSSTSSSKMRGSPYNFTRAGRRLSSGWADANSVGWYWSSTQQSGSTSKGSDLGLKSSSISMNYSDMRNGDSVRCIAEP